MMHSNKVFRGMTVSHRCFKGFVKAPVRNINPFFIKNFRTKTLFKRLMANNMEDGIKRVIRICCLSGIIKPFLNEDEQSCTKAVLTSDT